MCHKAEPGLPVAGIDWNKFHAEYIRGKCLEWQADPLCIVHECPYYLPYMPEAIDSTVLHPNHNVKEGDKLCAKCCYALGKTAAGNKLQIPYEVASQSHYQGPLRVLFGCLDTILK